MFELIIFNTGVRKTKKTDSFGQDIDEQYDAIQTQIQNGVGSLKDVQTLTPLTPGISAKSNSLAEIPGGVNRQEIIEKMNNYVLSEDVKNFINEYERLFGERNIFLWKFLGTVFEEAGVTLSSVDKRYLNSLTDNKILLSLLYTIIDDVADIYQDEKLLKEMLQILNNGSNVEISEKNEKILLVKKLWEHILKEISKYPRFEEFKDVFMYDFKQVLNSTDYSCLINNNPEMLNSNEMEIYDCHGMIVFLVNGIDLMASPELNKEDLPHLRTVFWHAQQMARIGNWLSTWKRELKENDISSGVFAYAFSKKILDIDDIRELTVNEVIKKIENSDTHEHFLNVWTRNHSKIKSLKDNIKSVDIDAYIAGLENVIKFHMASKGLK